MATINKQERISISFEELDDAVRQYVFKKYGIDGFKIEYVDHDYPDPGPMSYDAGSDNPDHITGVKLVKETEDEL